MKKKSKGHIVPELVMRLTQVHDAWIVGSAANPDADLSAVRDFDVVVPFGNWAQAALLIPSSARPNTFGGFKCTSEGREVDVWPEDLARLLTNVMVKGAWHPRSNTRVVAVGRGWGTSKN